jgi:hypothetical protein
MKFIKYVIILLSLTRCQPFSEQSLGICNDKHGPIRPCTEAEQTLIAGMRNIISQIRNFDATKLSKSFKFHGGPLNKSRVLIFGEKHTEIISQIQTLAAINFLAREGDILLLEGSDRRQKHQKNCLLFLIFQIYINWEWETLGQQYSVNTVKEKEQWLKKTRLDKLFRNTLNSYSISDLNLNKLRCGFWDDRDALRDTFSANLVNAGNFEKRNESMVLAIENALAQAPRVFVIAGYLHMPIGDFFHNRLFNLNNTKFPDKLTKYYDLMRRQPEQRKKFTLEETAGTTEPIYNYLKNNDITFTELLHGKLVFQ